MQTDRFSNSAAGVPQSQYYGRESILVGLDTEYVPGSHKNKLLSYQFYAESELGSWRGIHYPINRLSLSQFLSAVLALGRKNGLLEQYPKEIVLATHFGVADFSGFRDFEWIVRNVDSARNTLLSLSD